MNYVRIIEHLPTNQDEPQRDLEIEQHSIRVLWMKTSS